MLTFHTETKYDTLHMHIKTAHMHIHHSHVHTHTHTTNVSYTPETHTAFQSLSGPSGSHL